MQFQGKLMIQTQENGEKSYFGPKARCAQIWAAIFFFKNLVLSVTRYHGQLSSCTISEKTNDPILTKFSDGPTERPTDRQMDRQTDR